MPDEYLYCSTNTIIIEFGEVAKYYRRHVTHHCLAEAFVWGVNDTLLEVSNHTTSLYLPTVVLSALFLPYYVFIFQVRPVKASFVEYIVQDCPEGVTERGTCHRLTMESDTEVDTEEKRHCLHTINIPDLIWTHGNVMYH